MKLRYLLPVAFLVAVFSANYVYASVNSNASSKANPPVSTTTSNVSTTNSSQTTNSNASSQATNANTKNANGLTLSVSGIQNACLAHKNNIKRRDTQMYDLANNIINKFSVITSNVESYYNGTLIPKGITVANYTTLLNSVLTAQDTAQGELNQFNLDYGNFSCSSANPQAQVLSFNSDMKVEITDLNSYKSAVVNLLVAVRSDVGTTNSSNISK